MFFSFHTPDTGDLVGSPGRGHQAVGEAVDQETEEAAGMKLKPGV